MVQARAECALKALLPCLSAINEEDGVSHWGAEGLDTKNSDGFLKMPVAVD